jgi:hypothetical protein
MWPGAVKACGILSTTIADRDEIAGTTFARLMCRLAASAQDRRRRRLQPMLGSRLLIVDECDAIVAGNMVRDIEHRSEFHVRGETTLGRCATRTDCAITSASLARHFQTPRRPKAPQPTSAQQGGDNTTVELRRQHRVASRRTRLSPRISRSDRSIKMDAVG